ncbi:uncharacterized protein At3g60930, chloroplastic-like [Eutrema salsugineum]|uniref:uncharacterized protein At3g60930, chloroplastic-like n=1 Tax=Eutrema salsugineum TaxID=72664 RepID=UPI000CED0C1D|nr:uncharacterized protein At3g60930, chloroplastic-like [Eutrema salsugineum]
MRVVDDEAFDPMEAKHEIECLMGLFWYLRGSRVRRTDAQHRAHLPPPDHFTLYEAFYDLCFLWFPIPEVIREYLWKHKICIGQIMPRGLRYMIGILVQSFECHVDIELDHLLNLLEIRKINGASIGDGFISKIKTDRRPIVREFLPRCPDDLFEVWDTLAANRTHWKRHFSLERVERARSIVAGVLVSSELSNSSGDTRDKMVMEIFRERKKREAEEAWSKYGVIIAPEVTSNIPDEQRFSAGATKLAILALPHLPRPPTSKLVKHEAANRKRSAVEKGKGIVLDKDELLKKRQKAAVGKPTPKNLIVDDATASAQLFFAAPREA